LLISFKHGYVLIIDRNIRRNLANNIEEGVGGGPWFLKLHEVVNLVGISL